MTHLDIPKERAHALLERMLFIRGFEEKCAELYSAGKIRGFLHLYIGEEAVAVGAFSELRAEDNIVSTYREHGHALARGVSPGSVMAEMFGKVNGCSRGRGGSMHLFWEPARFYGGQGIVGAGLPVACGLALADSMSRRDAVTACFFGDGATDEGEYHEALNLAALWRLPVLFLCENNQYAMGTALERHAAETDLTRVPAAHRVPADHVDGMDVLAVARAVRYAVDTIRDGGGPRFLELRTYRFRAHSMYDSEKYRTKAEVAEWSKRDPIALFSAGLLAQGLLDDAEASGMSRKIAAEIEDAVRQAEAGEREAVEALELDVYAKERP